MANELTDLGENLALDYLNGLAPTAPVGPLKLALLTAQGTDAAAGTEVSGGSYARQNITLGASAGGTASNSNTITFAGLPAATVVGFAIYDSSATPRRLWDFPRTGGSVTVAAGDSIVVDPAGISVSIA